MTKEMIDRHTLREKTRKMMLIMRCKDGWYPIEDHADLPLADKAQAHGMRNAHVESIEDIDGNVLWRKQ